MNVLGQDRWELVTVVGARYMFKRPLPGMNEPVILPSRSPLVATDRPDLPAPPASIRDVRLAMISKLLGVPMHAAVATVEARLKEFAPRTLPLRQQPNEPHREISFGAARLSWVKLYQDDHGLVRWVEMNDVDGTAAHIYISMDAEHIEYKWRA